MATTTKKAPTVAPSPTLLQQVVTELAGADLRLSTYLLVAVSDAFSTKVMAWDPNGSNGNGRASGARVLLALLETTATDMGVTLPAELKGQVSKVARTVGSNLHSAHDLLVGSMGDDERIEACKAWVTRHGSPTQQVKKDPTTDTWDELMKNCTTRSNKLNGDDRGVEELVARFFKSAKDGERERMVDRLAKIDGRVRRMA